MTIFGEIEEDAWDVKDLAISAGAEIRLRRTTKGLVVESEEFRAGALGWWCWRWRLDERSGRQRDGVVDTWARLCLDDEDG